MKLSDRLIEQEKTGLKYSEMIEAVLKLEADSELLNDLIELMFNLPDGQLGICAFPLNNGAYRLLCKSLQDNPMDGPTPRAAIEAAVLKWKEKK